MNEEMIDSKATALGEPVAGQVDEPPVVTLVIPGRNCSATLERCLESVVTLKKSRQLKEIIFVDDGSTDTTAEIAARYPVRVIPGRGQGPGAARNLGWQAAKAELIWFIDSDCVAHGDALEQLLPYMSEARVAGVGGSYSNLFPDSILASLIHQEIVARHLRMPSEVDFLASFNVLYRRAVLAEVNGFDEALKLGQDADLAYRVGHRGYRLHFNRDSKVGHHHPTNLWRYLRTQMWQGYYRMRLYRKHPNKIKGDSYAGWLDYVQPPLAVCGLPMLLAFPWLGLMPILVWLGLFLLVQLPQAVQMMKVERDGRVLTFAGLGSIRALARGVGMIAGMVRVAGS